MSSCARLEGPPVGGPFFLENRMNTRRKPVNKRAGARGFRHEVSKTHPRNVRARPMRGGTRL